MVFVHSALCLQASCAETGLVCGVNGETYPSQCAAWADHVVTDYPGPCAASGYGGSGKNPDHRGQGSVQTVKREKRSNEP